MSTRVERQALRGRGVRTLLAAFGLIATALGVFGAFVPVLPTTPFLLLAAALFVHSSPRMHRWLTEHRRFGPIIARFQSRRGLSMRTKVWSTVAAAATLGVTGLLFTDSTPVRIVLAAVLAAKIIAMVFIPTAR